MPPFELPDTRSLRPFLFAAETLNFTQAARRAGLTQSGVSQHIARLEEALGVPLFRRVGRQVALTEAGRRLKRYVEKCVEETAALLEDIHDEMALPAGPVAYAMPASCLMSPHFPMLLEARKRGFPGIELKVTLCPSDEVFRKLLDAEIDFGFVTTHTGNPNIEFVPFCPEEYILVGSDAGALAGVSPETLAGRRFLWHPGVEILFGYWVAHHFPGLRLPWSALDVVGEINSLNGVIEMAQAGVGMTVLPRHCADAQLKTGRLSEFKGGNPEPLHRQIYIVTSKDALRPRRVQTVIDAFFEMKGSEPAPAAGKRSRVSRRRPVG